MNQQDIARLKSAIRERCIEFGDFELASGAKSSYYYNLKNILLDGSIMPLLGDALLDEIAKFDIDVKSVGGLETSAISLASAVTMRSYNKNTQGVKGFFVRKQPKVHGLKKRIEGDAIEPIIVIDDVLTKGSSIMAAIDALRQEGKDTKGVLVVIDREFPDNLLKQNGIKYKPLFTHSDFEHFIDKKLLISKLIRNLAN